MAGDVRRLGLMAGAATLLLLCISPAVAQLDPTADRLPPQLSDVSIEQRLNEQVPLQLLFHDERGQSVTLGKFFEPDKPVILSLVYFDCRMICSQALSSLATTMRRLKFDAGKQFQVLTISFDTRDKYEDAAAAKSKYLAMYNRAGAENGWHFLTGDQSSIDALANAVGFHLRWDARTQQFAHATGIMLLTPDGRISRYYYGTRYFASDLRLGLIEASKNEIGTLADQIVLYCYHYDPRTGRYGVIVFRVMQISGGFTLALVAGFILFFIRTDPNRRRRTLFHRFTRRNGPSDVGLSPQSHNYTARPGD
ncbi:MAG TPA: SCO family protein [Candidatus Sulfotelmatobacter sp.]|nr:SCO family protein [Candidatus Sulfotelmatobacter sp.]